MDLISATRTGGAPADSLIGVTDLEIIASGGSTWLVALGQVPGVMMSFTIGPGSLGYLGQTALPGGVSPLAASVLLTTLDGAPRLAVSGMTGTAYTWGWNAGSMGAPQALITLPQGLGRAATMELPAGNFLWGSEAAGSGFATWRKDAAGLVKTATIPDTDATFLDGITHLSTTRMATGDYLLALGGADHGLSSFRIDPGGALSVAGSTGALDGIGINRPLALVEVGPAGSGRLVMAAQGSSSLTVIRLLADGKPVATDHVIDSLDTRFANVTAIASATAQDRVFVVAGGSDGGISLFELLPNDRLVHHRVLLDGAATALDGVSALAAMVSGDVLSIFAGSNREQGLTRMDFSLAGLGPVIHGTPLDDVLTGTALDNLIWGGIGHDLILGGAGDDILIDGPGRDTLTGGAGADLFVIMRDLAPDLITDFDPLCDRIDLSSFRGLSDPRQIAITPTADGAELVIQGERLTVRSLDGLPLDPAIFSRAMLFNLPRSPQPIMAGLVIEGTAGGETLLGSTVADMISGYDGHDTISGGLGPDTLRGGAGDDVLWGDLDNDSLLGGAGNDQIFGGAGHDYIWGAEGDDTLWGDDDAAAPGGNDQIFGAPGNDLIFGFGGDDRLSGGKGRDTLWGGTGNDALYGDDDDDQVMSEDGNDTVVGGHGNDTLRGGAGNDKMSGETGDDVMEGEDGNDEMWGGAGDDTMEGGAGEDTVVGNAGNDHVHGGPGQDLLSGEDGADLITGGAGNDRLYGGSGEDTMSGDAGNDSLWGGADDDVIEGGDGSDLLFGEAGDDWLAGGRGNDTLWGGAGADTFVFAPGSGMDVIGDFSPATAFEVIDLGDFAYLGCFADLLPLMSQQGSDTVLTFDAETSLRILGIAPDLLAVDDFIFSA